VRSEAGQKMGRGLAERTALSVSCARARPRAQWRVQRFNGHTDTAAQAHARGVKPQGRPPASPCKGAKPRTSFSLAGNVTSFRAQAPRVTFSSEGKKPVGEEKNADSEKFVRAARVQT
jgi:hypothetical protein